MKRIAVLTSGGDAPGMNASIRAVVRYGINAGLEVYGIERGYAGLLDNVFVPLNMRSVSDIVQRGGTMLRTARSKEFATPQGLELAIRFLKKREIDGLIVIGGDGSMRGAETLSKAGFPTIGIPGTIDNDLMCNDHCPGYPSAARYVSQSFIGLNRDSWALGGTVIAVVMGRHAGFLTGAAAMGKKFPDDGPHLIYMPEREFNLDRFAHDVKQVYERYDRCVIAVSEGIHDSSGEPMITHLTNCRDRDAHGNIQLSGSGALGDSLALFLKEKLGIARVRADTLGYMQRSFVGCVSDVDQREAREVGEKAVQFAMWGTKDGSVAIRRTGFYSCDYDLVPLESVAAKTRVMPDEFISKEGNDITDAFRMYQYSSSVCILQTCSYHSGRRGY